MEKKAEKLKLSVDEIKPSGYFYRVYQEKNWVDTNLGRPRNNSANSTNKRKSASKKKPTRKNSRRSSIKRKSKRVSSI